MTDLLVGITLVGESDAVGASCSSWSPAVNDVPNANDVDDTTRSYRNSGVKGGTCEYSTIWRADLGAVESVAGFRALTSTGDHGHVWYLEHASSSSGPWTEAHEWIGSVTGDELVTFDDPIDARHWRLRVAFVRTGGVLFVQAASVYSWELTAAGDEPPPEPEPEPEPGEYVPPEPSKAIVEIFVDDPNGAKWDVARWDEAVWPAAFWDAIDDLSLTATVTAGSDRGDLGAVAEPTAGRFTVTTFDPDRILDPANASSPYAGQLEPGLPIRINHRSTTFRTARVQRITYSFDLRGGTIEATDAIGQIAEPLVPADVDLADTLWTRIADAIAAAGVDVELLPAPANDPALVPYTPGDELTVLEHLKRAALEVLWTPYVASDGRIGFRDWTSGLERGRELAAPELMDLGSWISDDGLYSRVVTLDEDGITPVVREATPTPRYGLRTYTRRRELATIDAESWADRVLADRRAQGLRYRPGELRPLDADAVELFGTLEVLEGVDISVPTAPGEPVAVHARIIGSRIYVQDETKETGKPRSRWRFTFTVAAAPPVPLVSDEDVTSFLVTEDETDYLYAG